jgi:hypothetical protein
MLPHQGQKYVSRFGSRTGLVFVGSVLAFVIVSACGGEDSKKKVGPRYDSAGEGGGGANGVSGSRPSPGGSGSAGEPATGNGGEGAGNADGGTGNEGGSNTAVAGQGAGGSAGAPAMECSTGTADCDDDPTDCEADVTLLTQCGTCGVRCVGTNGTVVCGDRGCEMTTCIAGFGDCNDSGVDGCEVDLQTSQNCGVCGHSCGAAACTAGLCAATLLGSSLPAYRWASTADAIYRFDCNTPNYSLPTDYKLVRTPLDGGAEVLMASDGKAAGDLAVDADFVYWAVNGTPPAVFKKAHGAAAATAPTPLFEPASLPVQLQIQGAAMYWMAVDGQIYTRALSAGVADPGSLLINAADVKGAGTFNLHQDFVTTPTMMYWVVLPASGNQAFIRSASLNGQNVADVTGAITNNTFKLWVNGEDLYWIRATGAALDGAYHFKKGGSVEPLVIQTDLNAIMVDGNYLYLGQANATLLRAPIAGGATVKLGTGIVQDFATADAAHLYSLQPFTHGSGFTSGSKIYSFPK